MEKKLVILSVPFLRVAKVLLGPSLLRAVSENNNILLVSPIFSEEQISTLFGEHPIQLLRWGKRAKKSRLITFLQTISNIQRVNSFYYRNRKKVLGMKYHAHRVFQPEIERGKLKKNNRIKAALYYLVTLTGTSSKTWKLADYFLGLCLGSPNNLNKIIKDYDDVTLIQSCNWGEQDIDLARFARKRKIKSILVPYTTDQIYCNGFFLNNFHAVFVQGEFEKKCAKTLHALSDDKIIKAGSAWFRNIDEVMVANNLSKEPTSKDSKVILFTGSSSKYFPASSERKILQRLESAIKNNVLSDCRIIYRPMPISTDEKEKIKEELSGCEFIELQFPELSVMGLEHDASSNMYQEWKHYIQNLLNIDIHIMSLTTSMALDTSYLGKPVFAVIYDDTGYIDASNFKLKLDPCGKIPGLEKVTLISDTDLLVEQINNALKGRHKTTSQVAHTKKMWDYPSVNFDKMLLSQVNI